MLDGILPNIMLSAVRANQVIVVNELIKFSKELLGAHNNEGYNIFHALSYNYSNRMAATLIANLSKETRSKLLNEVDLYGCCPLDYAIKFNCRDCINTLVTAGAKYPETNLNQNVVSDILK